ncbi:hypothetical protein L218DRAFT_50861 [Marasmius fiardii PR-910]|nr:hypothetical protein L218DRAFT_50861 [Marasmius fiardii PR-910]
MRITASSSWSDHRVKFWTLIRLEWKGRVCVARRFTNPLGALGCSAEFQYGLSVEPTCVVTFCARACGDDHRQHFNCICQTQYLSITLKVLCGLHSEPKVPRPYGMPHNIFVLTGRRALSIFLLAILVLESCYDFLLLHPFPDGTRTWIRVSDPFEP